MLAAKLRASRDLDLAYTEIAYPLGTAAALGRRVAHWPGKLVVKPTGEDVHSVPEAVYGFDRYVAPRMLTDWTLRQADAVRCISPLVLEAIATRTAAMRRVIPSGVANSTVDEARRDLGVARADRDRCRREVAAEFGLGDAKVVLALGRIHPIKGLEYLVRAMARVRETVLILAGPSLSVRPHGDHATYLRSIASEEGVSARVRFPGYIAHERVHQILAAADVLVVPSLLEAMNKVAVEAASSGTPFVATETTGVWKFVRRDGMGRAVPPRDPQARARAITDILDGGWQFDHDAAREFVMQFAPASVTPQLVELFEDTLP